MGKISGRRDKKGGRGQGGHKLGVRTVALFEAAKGLVVVMAGLGLLALIHRDAQAVAEEIVRYLHLNPAKQIPRIFLEASTRVTDARLWALALTAAIYSTIRFAEAYGLWRQQIWAEWFGILSGSIYLPVELYELTVRISPPRLAVFLVNLLVVGWLSWIRWRERGRG